MNQMKRAGVHSNGRAFRASSGMGRIPLRIGDSPSCYTNIMDCWAEAVEEGCWVKITNGLLSRYDGRVLKVDKRKRLA